MQIGSPAAGIAERPIDFNQLAAIGMPSSRMDTQLQDGLTALDTNGYIQASDLVQLLPSGILRGMPPPPAVGPTNAQARKAACG